LKSELSLSTTRHFVPLASRHRMGGYTASRTISRVVSTGSNIFVDSPVAAVIATGGPSDIDAGNGVLGVIDHGAGESHLSLFTYNAFGELAPSGTTITLGVADANGVAILAPSRPGSY